MLSVRVLQGAGQVLQVSSSDGKIVFTAPVAGLLAKNSIHPPPVPTGLAPASDSKNIDPPVIAFGTEGTVMMTFSPSDLVAAGIDPATLAIYQAAPGQNFTRMPSQILDPIGNTVTGFLSQVQFNTDFQIFGTTRSFSQTNGAGDLNVLQSSTSTLNLAWNANGNSPDIPRSGLLCDRPRQRLRLR